MTGFKKKISQISYNIEKKQTDRQMHGQTDIQTGSNNIKQMPDLNLHVRFLFLVLSFCTFLVEASSEL